MVMIKNFQNRLSGSRDMTIFGKMSLQNRKIILNPKQAAGGGGGERNWPTGWVFHLLC